MMFFFLVIRFFRSIWVGLKDKEFRALFIWVVIVIAIGTTFYARVEGWRVLDALYFTIITLTTIGYGDLTPQTDAGKIFTMVYIFVGISLISGFIILLGEHSRKLKMLGRNKEE
ncbi:MAG TPA: potassium channel family protein [Anaerolineales bacterium]|nr:potassium channel family protein [Anaerolineales bacterium]